MNVDGESKIVLIPVVVAVSFLPFLLPDNLSLHFLWYSILYANSSMRDLDHEFASVAYFVVVYSFVTIKNMLAVLPALYVYTPYGSIYSENWCIYLICKIVCKYFLINTLYYNGGLNNFWSSNSLGLLASLWAFSVQNNLLI